MNAPKLPTIFKQPKAKTFEFQPRFYNERKERIEKLKQKYSNTEDTKPHDCMSLRNEMSSEWSNMHRTGVKTSTNRLLGMIIVLVLLTYLIIT